MPAALKTETWTPEALASLRDDTSQLANMACDLDDLKNRLPHPELRAALIHVVGDMHTAAQHFDRLHGFGLYAAPDGEASSVGISFPLFAERVGAHPESVSSPISVPQEYLLRGAKGVRA